MFTYIQKDCKEYVELELELDTEIYPVGSTLEDYEDGKWIKLSDEQLQFKQDNPDATKEEVIEMELTSNPETSDEELLREAKYNKEKDIFSKVQDYYTYNLDGVNIFTFNTLGFKDKCDRYDSVTINSKDIDSDILVIALGEMGDYAEKVQEVLNSKIQQVRNCQSVSEVNLVDSSDGYPEPISKTTEQLNQQLEEKNHNDINYQSVSFAKMMVNTVSMSANKALEMQVLFPIWGQEDAEFGKEVEVGFRLRVVKEDSDTLYEVIQKHTLSEEWEPGINTASLYKTIDIEHTGTQEDPIPYSQGMVLELGKYYSQYGVVYVCIQATSSGLPYDLSDMVSIVQKVE